MATAEPAIPSSTRAHTRTPHGNFRWNLTMVAAGVLFLVGLYAYVYEYRHGMVATGMRDLGVAGGAPWGLYIVTTVYFMGVAFAGITVAALIRLLRLRELQTVARMGEVLTVVALVLGALLIVADLGQPLRGVVNLLRYARPQSPFFGTFTLVVAGYLFASLVFLYLDSRRDAAILAQREGRLRWLHRLVAAGYTDTPAERERHARATFWLAIAIIPLLVTATSTLGFVFGLQGGRPGWFSALQAPGFVVLAGVSGTGMLIALAALLRRVLHRPERLHVHVFVWLGRLLLGLVLVYLYFTAVEVLTAVYAAGPAEQRVTSEVFGGTYAWMYWSAVGLFVLAAATLVWQAVSRRWSIGVLVASGLAVNVAALAKRYVIVVPSQTHGTLLPYEAGSYTPTWVEYGVVLGLFGLGVLLIGLYVRLFPMLELHEEVAGDA